MEMLSGAEMVVRSLIDQGVKQVFGYPGGAVLDIYDALHTVGGIDHVLVRHEQAAVHMADGLARATGEVGVVLVTSGPGATNAITGIATAYMDSIPLVILSGQVATSLIGYDAFQECDMVGISRPVVKHSFLVKQTEDIPSVLKKAFWLAASAPGAGGGRSPERYPEPGKQAALCLAGIGEHALLQPNNAGPQRSDQTRAADAAGRKKTGGLCRWRSSQFSV